MAGQWQLTALEAAAQATASQTAGTTGGLNLRLRSVVFTLSGTGAGAVTCVVRDGATGTGTIIWQGTLNTAANASGQIEQNNVDLRATSGTLTVETTGSGGANTTTSLNAQGDYVATGVAYLGGLQ